MTEAQISPESIDSVVVRFAGDSGDGMQLTGTQFTLASAVAGNDLATLPDFPAEIRAPAGTLYGVSGFQVQFSKNETLTPGDQPDVLVAMNPAALKSNLGDLPKGGVIIANSDAFVKRNLDLVNYESNPLEDDSLSDYQLHVVPMTSLTVKAVESVDGINTKAAKRCTNFFALGLVSWLYSRPLGPSEEYLEAKFGKKMPAVAEANKIALHTGHNYGETMEAIAAPFEVAAADIPKGRYRTINGNLAIAMGLVTGARKAGLDLVFAGYPITPASSLLEELAGLKHMGVKTMQMEDEIAAAGAALGASYGGAIGITASSGPGIALKSEMISLAVGTELPMVIVDIQRGGPSTGLPTKTEQSDLYMAMYGRHGEAPLPIVAARSPADAFKAAFEAVRIAIQHMTPVILLSDGSIANGAEPWLIPDEKDLPDIVCAQHTDPETFKPYARDPVTGARPWAIPGTPGLEHRIGGIEKAHIEGNISYDPDNHALMTKLRREKVEKVAASYSEEIFVDGAESGKLLVLGWGSTFGAIKGAVKRSREKGVEVSHMHLRYINPFHDGLGQLLAGFDRVLIPEINDGQLLQLIRAKFLVDAEGYSRIRGLPLKVSELEAAIEAAYKEEAKA